MVQRLDLTIPIHDGISTEDDRVQFLNGIASELASKANIYLNTRKLYSADGHAVKELLKIAHFLYKSSVLAEEASDSEEMFHVEANIQDARKARSLATEITEIGAKLHDLLKKEPQDSQERKNAIKFLNSISGISADGSEKGHIETSITHILDSTREMVERLDKQCKMILSNEKGIDEKIRKKTIDLERNSKRLESLKNVRPAFMDEYEQLEDELQSEYERYMVRFRNVDYLEGDLMTYNNSVIEKQEEADRNVKRLQNKFREEELRILEEGAHYDESEEEHDVDSSMFGHGNKNYSLGMNTS